MELRKNEIKSGFFQGTPIFGKINNSIKFARCYRIGSMLYYSYLPYRKFRKKCGCGALIRRSYLPYRKFIK